LATCYNLLPKNALLQNEILITWRQHLAIFSQIKAFVFVARVFFFPTRLRNCAKKNHSCFQAPPCAQELLASWKVKRLCWSRCNTVTHDPIFWVQHYSNLFTKCVNQLRSHTWIVLICFLWVAWHRLQVQMLQTQ